MTNEMPESPLVKKFVDAARTDPQGAEASLEKAVRNIERWMDERLIQGDRRRELQIRIDRAISDARMQLSRNDLTQAAFADVAGDETHRSRAFDTVKQEGTAQMFRWGRIGAAVVLASIIVAALGWRMNFFTIFSTRPLFVLHAGTSITPAKDNTIERTPGEPAFTLYSTAKRPMSGGATGGAYLTLPPEIEDLASGRTVRVTISAAPVSDRPTLEFAVAYSTAAVGNSGWHRFQSGPGLHTWSFEYAVPKRQPKPGQDFIGIWADTSGKGGGIRIEEIQMELVESVN